MACGEKRNVLESFWTWCTFHWNYPCGIRYCTFSFTYPCGMTTCSTSSRYPCGIRWCRKWGIRYPCGISYCHGTLTYPCIKYCTARVSYPCGFKYCKGTGYYPCRSYYEVAKYCYDYSTARESQLLVASKLTFCCDGQEYSAWKKSLGLGSTTHGSGTACYYELLKPSGGCTSASVPSGTPVEPLDEGSVAPHRSAFEAATGSRSYSEFARSKLGTCTKCVRAVLFISVISWIVSAVSTGSQALHYAFFILAVLSTTLLFVHLIAFIMQLVSSRSASKNCNGKRR